MEKAKKWEIRVQKLQKELGSAILAVTALEPQLPQSFFNKKDFIFLEEVFLCAPESAKVINAHKKSLQSFNSSLERVIELYVNMSNRTKALPAKQQSLRGNYLDKISSLISANNWQACLNSKCFDKVDYAISSQTRWPVYALAIRFALTIPCSFEDCLLMFHYSDDLNLRDEVVNKLFLSAASYEQRLDCLRVAGNNSALKARVINDISAMKMSHKEALLRLIACSDISLTGSQSVALFKVLDQKSFKTARTFAQLNGELTRLDVISLFDRTNLKERTDNLKKRMKKAAKNFDDYIILHWRARDWNDRELISYTREMALKANHAGLDCARSIIYLENCPENEFTQFKIAASNKPKLLLAALNLCTVPHITRSPAGSQANGLIEWAKESLVSLGFNSEEWLQIYRDGSNKWLVQKFALEQISSIAQDLDYWLGLLDAQEPGLQELASKKIRLFDINAKHLNHIETKLSSHARIIIASQVLQKRADDVTCSHIIALIEVLAAQKTENKELSLLPQLIESLKLLALQMAGSIIETTKACLLLTEESPQFQEGYTKLAGMRGRPKEWAEAIKLLPPASILRKVATEKLRGSL